MRSGFFRGILIGAAIGTASGILLNPRTREKAKEVISQSGEMLKQGGQMLRSAENTFENTGSFLEKSRQLFQDDDEEENKDKSPWRNYANTENITARVAYLEQRLEELENKGV